MSLSLVKVEQPSPRIRSRAALMWTRKIKEINGLLEYRVCPHGSEFEHKSKSKRRVVIDLIRMTAKCTEWHSGTPCQANASYVIGTGQSKEPRMCAHVWAVLERLAMNMRREERKAA